MIRKRIVSLILVLCVILAAVPSVPVQAGSGGTITVAVERFAIGQGYLIEPYTTSFNEGDTYETVCRRVLKENGYSYTTGGSSFYLSGIDGADKGKISIPSCIKKLGSKKVGIKVLNPPDNSAVNEFAGKKAWLGEFSYSRMSGWMYSIGNDAGYEFPGVGMDGTKPEDGDVFRLQFTIWGYGEDLTGVKYADESTVYYEVGDKTMLTRKIAQINQDKAGWMVTEGRRTAYNYAVKVLSKLDAAQSELDKALSNLNTADADQEAQKQAKARKTFMSGKPAVEVKAEAYNQVKVSWKKYTNSSSYCVYRKAPGKNWSKLGETTGTSFTDKKAQTGVTYYYTVKAVSKKWGSTVYSRYVTNVKTKTSLGRAVIKKVTAGKASAVITWKKVSGASGYVIYSSSSKNGKYKSIKTISSGSTVKYTNTKLKKGTYYYKVKAFRTVGGKRVYGAESDSKSVKVIK